MFNPVYGSVVTGDLAKEPKDTLVKLLCAHAVRDGRLHIEERLALPLLRGLGLDVAQDAVVDTPRRRMLYDPCQPDFTTRYPAVHSSGKP